MNCHRRCHFKQSCDTQHVYSFGDRVNQVVEAVP